MSLRSELRNAFRGATFRRYRCTGKNCDFRVEALAGMEISCPNAKCRGRCVPGKVVPTIWMVDDVLRLLEGPSVEKKSPDEGTFCGVSPPQKPQESSGELGCQLEDSVAFEADISTGENPAPDSPHGRWKQAS